MHRNSEQRRSCVGVCTSVRVRTSVHACVRDVFAIYDDNNLSRLIMIIIKIIILYFIQIRHTDDFPSAGIPASTCNSACLQGSTSNDVTVIFNFPDHQCQSSTQALNFISDIMGDMKTMWTSASNYRCTL